MPVSVLSLGPTYNITQNVVYALSGAPCYVKASALLQRATLEAGPFTDWPNSTNLVYNFRGGFVRCALGNATVTPTKIKMKQMKQSAYKAIRDGASNLWRLNETSGLTAVDIVGGANGTISGGVTLNGESGMTFNGISGKIVTAAQPLPTKFSVEVWIKISVLAPLPIFSNGVSGATYEMFLGTDNTGRIHFLAVGAAQIYSTSIVANGLWRHIVYTLDSTAALYKIFVDGREEASGAMAIGVLTNPFNIGFAPAFLSYWNGQIDDVAIYPRALTPAEVLDHSKVAR